MKKKIKWNEYYSIAAKLYTGTGNINVPVSYTFEGYDIGRWIRRQRNIYKSGKLNQNQIVRLENLGMIWDGNVIRQNQRAQEWERFFSFAKEYYEKYGNLDIPVSYEIEGVKLGEWLHRNRMAHRGKKGTPHITEEQFKRLESIGAKWDHYEESIDTKWNDMYALAKEYYIHFGDLSIPQDKAYKGKKLGSWVHVQRQRFLKRKLELDRQQLLESIGMIWYPSHEKWESFYSAAKDYYKATGNLNIPYTYEKNGLNLGRWISVQRQAYNGREDVELTDEQISKLNDIGMLWQGDNSTQTSFNEQAVYYYLKKHFSDTVNRFSDFGFEVDVYVPSLKTGIEYDGEYWHETRFDKDNEKDKMCKQKGIRLIRIREGDLQNTSFAINYRCPNYSYKNYSLLLERILLEQFNIHEKIDISNDAESIIRNYRSVLYPNNEKDFEDKDKQTETKPIISASWQEHFLQAKDYFATFSNLDVAKDYKYMDGFALGKWIASQRQTYKGHNNSFLTKEQISLLEEIGMIWDKNQYDWEKAYSIAQKYYDQYGNLLPEQNCIYEGFKLGKWINTQRSQRYKKGIYYDPNRIELLERIGMVWNAKDAQWMKAFALARDFYNTNGHCNIPHDYKVDGFNLGWWISGQRALRKRSQTELTKQKIEKLDSIGMIWNSKDNTWETNITLSKIYLETHGDLLIPSDYVIDGIALGKWIANLRNAKKGRVSMPLTPERIELLNSMNMIWDVNEYQWEIQFAEAKSYYETEGNLRIPVRYVSNGLNIGSWLKNQKAAKKRGKLCAERIEKLETIGIEWRNE